jgi:cysteinyl-tRNA synthetase
LNTIPIDSTDLPSDVRDLLGRITEVQHSERPMSFTLKELGTISQAVGGMKRAVTRGLRSAPSDDAADALSDVLGELKGLQARIEATVRDAFVETLGPDFDQSAAAKQLQRFIESNSAPLQEQAPSSNSLTDLPDQAAYL